MSQDPNRSVAENYIRALHDCGITHVFSNGGTDFAPLIEGIVRMRGRGEPTPNFVTVQIGRAHV